MIYEKRTYTINPLKMADWLALYQSDALAVQTDHLGQLIGFFFTEIGVVNQVVHIWAYESLDDRLARRARMTQDERWLTFSRKNRELAAVERAEAAWEAAGKRYARLATSGAFHSPLMQSAADELDAYLAEVDFKQPSVPLICNTDAQPLSAETARRHLVDHLTHPVRFEQSVQTLVDQGAAVFAEVGFGGVLSNLVKRIDRKAARPCIQDTASFDAFVSEYAEDKE